MLSLQKFANLYHFWHPTRTPGEARLKEAKNYERKISCRGHSFGIRGKRGCASGSRKRVKSSFDREGCIRWHSFSSRVLCGSGAARVQPSLSADYPKQAIWD